MILYSASTGGQDAHPTILAEKLQMCWLFFGRSRCPPHDFGRKIANVLAVFRAVKMPTPQDIDN
jgi:hypothetical protein